MALTWQRIDLGGDDAERDVWRRGDPADAFDLPDLAAFLNRPPWHAAAACRGQGTERWFVRRGVSAAAARYFCDRCPVRAACLADALSRPASTDSGIWAGTTVKDREEMRRTAAAE